MSVKIFGFQLATKGDGYCHALENRTIVIEKDSKRIELKGSELIDLINALGIRSQSILDGYNQT